jgi:hypothetical protein
MAVPFAIAQTVGFHQPTVDLLAMWALLTCVDMGLIGAMVLLGQKSERQNLARKAMIADPAEANQRLEEMMAENTGLQLSCSPRPGRRAPVTNGSGWRGRSMTRSRRA